MRQWSFVIWAYGGSLGGKWSGRQLRAKGSTSVPLEHEAVRENFTTPVRGSDWPRHEGADIGPSMQAVGPLDLFWLLGTRAGSQGFSHRYGRCG